MRTFLLTFLLLISVCPAFCEDTDKAKLPDDAASAMSMYDAETTNLKADFDKAVAAKTKVLRVKLEKAQEAATKKGNLDGALAVKAAIEKLPKDGTKAPDRPFEIKPKGGVYLGSLNPKNAEGYDIKIVKGEKDADRVVIIDNARCFEYIWAHAPSDLVFDIPAGTKQFTSYALSQSSQNVRFIVIIDGKEKFSQEPGGKPIPVNVMIPDGAKRIQLIVNTVGSSNNAAHSLWAFPYFAK